MVTDCCTHTGRDEHGCWDCYNTGHAHDPSLPCDGTPQDPYLDPEKRAALRAFADGLPAKHIDTKEDPRAPEV